MRGGPLEAVAVLRGGGRWFRLQTTHPAIVLAISGLAREVAGGSARLIAGGEGAERDPAPTQEETRMDPVLAKGSAKFPDRPPRSP